MPLYQPENVNKPVLDQFSLKGKIAAATGGAGGIGIEIARGLAEAGADVALIYSGNKRAPDIAAQIARETGVRVEAFQSDVASRSAITATIEDIAANSGKGKLNAVVANSGVVANVPALEYTEESWNRNICVNYDGVMWTAQAAGKIFKQQGHGNLIFTASVSATLVNLPQTQAAYNASKAAVVHPARCLAVVWADFARVNCIPPGFIMTESTCSGGLSTIRGIADTCTVLTKQPKERMDQWMSMIPGRRICHPAKLKSVRSGDVWC